MKKSDDKKKGKTYRLPANYMDVVYKRSGKIESGDGEDGLAVLKVENKGFYNGIAQKFFKKPRFSRISLDKYGTVVWNSLDGTNSVYDVLEKMKQTFPDEQERMLDRLVHFLKILEVNGYIDTK